MRTPRLSTTAKATDVQPSTVPRPRALRARRITIRVVYTLLSIWTLMMSMGLVGLLTGGVPAGPYGFGAGATTVWKLQSCGGFVVLAWTAGRSVPAAQWVVVGQATWLTADLLAPQDPTSGPGATVLLYTFNTLVFLGPWLLLAPERREVLHLHARPDRVALGVAVLLLPLAALWARNNAALRIPTIGENDGAELTFDLVGLALVLGFVGVFAALRPRGARWLIGTLAAAFAYLGVLTLLTSPTDLASPGRAGGLTFLALAVFFSWRARATIGVSRA